MVAERPAQKYQLGTHVRNSKNEGVFIFCCEWGPDNRLIRASGWAYHVYDPAKGAGARVIVTEEELAAFAAL